MVHQSIGEERKQGNLFNNYGESTNFSVVNDTGFPLDESNASNDRVSEAKNIDMVPESSGKAQKSLSNDNRETANSSVDNNNSDLAANELHTSVNEKKKIDPAPEPNDEKQKTSPNNKCISTNAQVDDDGGACAENNLNNISVDTHKTLSSESSNDDVWK